MKKIVIFASVILFMFGVILPQGFCMDMDEEKHNYSGSGKGEAALADLIFLRPLGLASFIIGLSATIISTPFSLGRNDMNELGGALVGETSDYTFVRPLGQID